MRNHKARIIVASVLILIIVAVGHDYVTNTLSGATIEEQWVQCANVEPDNTIAQVLGFHYTTDFLIETPRVYSIAIAALAATVYILLRTSPRRKVKK